LGLGEGQGFLFKPPGDPMSVRLAIRTWGEFAFDTTPGEVYHPGDVVYLGADAQRLTKVALGTPVGKVADDQTPLLQGADGFSAVITGGAAAGGLAQRVVIN